MFEWIKKLAKAGGTSGAFTSLGVMGPVAALVLLVVNTWWGGAEDLITVAGAEVAVNNLIAVVGFVLGVIGRIRAKKEIVGPFGGRRSGTLVRMLPILLAVGVGSQFLSGCGGSMTSEEKAAAIRVGVSATCGVLPQLSDLLAVSVHPGFVGVSATVRLICDQVDSGQTSALPSEEGVSIVSGLLQHHDTALTLFAAKDDECIAIVNGVCIRAEDGD